MRCTLFVVLLVSLASFAAPAFAQAVATTDAEAHAVFEAGRSAYAAGRFQDALGDFERAYELSERPELLYNIGQCQDRLRHDADAIATFEAYQTALPDAPQHDEIMARLAILRAAVQAGTQAPEVAAPEPESVVSPIAEPPAPAPPPPSSADPAPWIVAGIGGAVVIVGAILLGVGYSDVSSVESARNVPYSSVSGAYNDAPVFTGVGWGMLGVGVAALAIGLGWGLASGGGASEHARLHIGPTGLSISGSF